MQGDGNLEKVEASLAKARGLIKQALLRTNDIVPLEDSHDYIPQGDIYRNAFAFHRYDFMNVIYYERGTRILLIIIEKRKNIWVWFRFFFSFIHHHRQFNLVQF
jgi:hypothetical protein